MALPTQDKIKTLGEKETYKYLDILEVDIIKHVEMKEKLRKNIPRVQEFYLRQNCQAETLSKNVPLVRYAGSFLKWTRGEIKQMDQRKRKLLTIHKILHPRDDVDNLYVSRKECRKRTYQH